MLRKLIHNIVKSVLKEELTNLIVKLDKDHAYVIIMADSTMSDNELQELSTGVREAGFPPILFLTSPDVTISKYKIKEK